MSHTTVYRGVNMGGWLVLERWITPTLFKGVLAKDEFSFCHELGSVAHERLAAHHATFITEADLQWIAEHGLNAVRLPVPHWIFGNVSPYASCVSSVEWLLDLVPKYGLSVLLDLHAAPGSQNGWDHSGKAGKIGWTTEENIQRTLDVLRVLAESYGSHPAVIGIELMNEPHPTIKQAALLDFYRQGISAVRTHAPNVPIIVSDAFRPRAWNDTFLAGVRNTWLDMHLYQAFDAADKKLDIHKHIKKAKYEWRDVIADVQAYLPVVVGEWSLGLETKTFRGMDDFERDKAVQAYGRAQLDSFEQTQGWFFWNYKTETMAAWSYRDAIARGWMPTAFS